MSIVQAGLCRIFAGLDEETELYYQIWAREVTLTGAKQSREAASPGSVIFLVHGSDGDLRNPTLKYDWMVRTGHRILTYDHRGSGRSALDLDASHYSMRQYAEDAAALMREMGVPSATILGLSFGGMVAQELVIRHPELCERLVLASTVARVTWNFMEPAMVADYFLTLESLLVSDLLMYILWPLAVLLAALNALPKMRRCMRADGQDVSRQRGDVFWDRCRLYCFDARNYHDARGRLGDVKCDVLVLSGHRDHLAPRWAQAQLAAEFTGARSVRHIATWAVGHSVFWDLRMYAALKEFMEGKAK